MKNESEYAVHLQKDGVTESFLPGDEIPAWAARLIKNPLVTGDAVEEDGVVKEKEHKTATKRALAKAAPKADEVDSEA